MLVHAPKTEHHEGGGDRVVPIFPELRPYLDDAWAVATDKAEFVVSRRAGAGVNLRTHLLRIIKRAGLKPWPKPFQNLRASRETELAERFPMHVVCSWIGNSERIAAKHYLQVTDDHFDLAQEAAQIRRILPQKRRKYGAAPSALRTRPKRKNPGFSRVF